LPACAGRADCPGHAPHADAAMPAFGGAAVSSMLLKWILQKAGTIRKALQKGDTAIRKIARAGRPGE
jgi:hypothetical protein